MKINATAELRLKVQVEVEVQVRIRRAPRLRASFRWGQDGRSTDRTEWSAQSDNGYWMV